MKPVAAYGLSKSYTDAEIAKKFNGFMKTGKNLYNKSNRMDGWRINSSGEINQAGLAYNYATSDYLHVEAGKTIYFSDNKVSWGFDRLLAYDSSDNVIDFVNAGASTYLIPPNVVKIRFSGAIARMQTTAQVEYGKVTTFEEYKEYVDQSFLKKADDTFYVAFDGSDANDGLSQTTPLQTFSKAIALGAKTIHAKRGVYNNQKIVLSDVQELTVLPYGVGDFIKLQGDSPFSNPVNLSNVSKLKLVGIKVVNADVKGFRVLGCNGEIIDCMSVQSSSDGFSLDGSNLILHNCVSDQAGRDGFNIHELNGVSCYTEFHNCKALNSADDGISHHGTCRGAIFGGVYKNCVSGGVTPYGQAEVNVHNAIIEGNGTGLLAFQSGDILAKPTVYSSNNLIKGNGVGIAARYYDIISIGDKLVENATPTSETSGTITVY